MNLEEEFDKEFSGGKARSATGESLRPCVWASKNELKSFIRKAIQEAEKRGHERAKEELSEENGRLNTLAYNARREAQLEIIEAIPSKKDQQYFYACITHADEELMKIQTRSMEIGYNQAISDLEARLKQITEGQNNE
jgi:hypothetical protein